MSQRAIPCIFMRGGTSRGPFFLQEDLPSDPDLRDCVLLRVMGSPDARQIDGIGGATSVTSKVAIISASEHPGIDVDYLFAQVDLTRRLVDTTPTCGNMLSGVGPVAIERGLVRATEGRTSVTVRNVNTESIVDVVVETPDGILTYEGDCQISGVPGTAAPIELRFHNIVGSKTGAMLPTGHRREAIQDTEVSLVDIAMPLVVVEARALGKTGRETPDELEADTAFMAHIEAVRCEAGHRMGFGDVSERVVPKLAMVAPPGAGGHLASRYFTPWQCHPTYAVTGSIGVCAAAALSGTIASDVVVHDHRFPDMVVIEHPVGELQVALDLELTDGLLDLRSAGLVRTARKLLSGDVHIPYSTWPGQA